MIIFYQVVWSIKGKNGHILLLYWSLLSHPIIAHLSVSQRDTYQDGLFLHNSSNTVLFSEFDLCILLRNLVEDTLNYCTYQVIVFLYLYNPYIHPIRLHGVVKG